MAEPAVRPDVPPSCVSKGSSPFADGVRPDVFLVGALAAHLAVALSARVSAWPEVTTPAYLMSRGMLLYRDIKFVHTPGLMVLLAAAFGLFGVTSAAVRGVAIFGPLVAHVLVLRQTRRFPLAVRALASAFFLVLVLDWDGSAVWPSILMMPLALPIAAALTRRRLARAGLGIGLAILLKQTAAYVLVVCVARSLWKRRFAEIPTLLLWASLPYAAAAAVFGMLGSGPAFLEWTLLIPFRLKGVIDAAPAPEFLFVLGAAALPLAIESAIEKPGEYDVGAGELLTVALGFFVMIYPRFGFAHAAAAIPCLAVGAARLLARPGWRQGLLSYGLAAVIVITRGAGVVAATQWDSRIEYWDRDPAFNILVDRLRTLPRDTPLASDLFFNVFPRSGLLPPGRLYYAPWLYYLARFDSIGERAQAASRHPSVVRVRHRAATERVGAVGPYVIERGAT